MCTQISENPQHESVLFYQHKKYAKLITLQEAQRALRFVIDYTTKRNEWDSGILILLGQMQERLEQSERDQEERDYLDICKQTGLHQNLQRSTC